MIAAFGAYKSLGQHCVCVWCRRTSAMLTAKWLRNSLYCICFNVASVTVYLDGHSNQFFQGANVSMCVVQGITDAVLNVYAGRHRTSC